MHTFWRIFYTVLFLATAIPVAAQTYTANNGHVYFLSEAFIQNIEAHSVKLGGALRLEDRTFAFSIPIESFKFERALMQEHFNESYLESEKYPRATFTGKLLDSTNFSIPGTYPVTAVGKLTIHGVSQERTIHGVIVSDKNRLTLEALFPVKISNHNIRIPRLLFETIAETVQVKVNMTLRTKE
ncbi:YceI family protein [Adhaeribacter sp. BT258]|uniref:YceI family protein n=1 Tax=Adhaeribacter terrigena TaxID=2793070 RepID=A0ABS1C5H8_9BACT|nr:YceI family protein [Adhaeribacter terrigena]MBK0404558.1 YceI family protein [Adhaeribacter terrigena]